MSRRCALVLLVGVLLLGSTGCSLFSSSGPEDAFRAFAEALQRKDAACGGRGNRRPVRGDSGHHVDVRRHGAQRVGDRRRLRPGGRRRQPGHRQARLHVDVRTRTHPAVRGHGHRHARPATTGACSGPPPACIPKLGPGVSFQYSDDKNFLTPVVDRDGQPLLTWQTIGVVNLTRAHLDSAPALAPLLSAVRRPPSPRRRSRPSSTATPMTPSP